MKTDAEWLEELKEIVVEIMGPKEVSLESYVRRDLQIPSLDLVDILFELENRAGLTLIGSSALLELTGGESTDFRVGQLIDHVKKLQKL